MDLKDIRKDIDSIDNQILELLEKRLSLMPSVIDYKIKNNLDIFDSAREKEILKNKISTAKNFSMDEKFITEIYQLIMDQSKKIQRDYLKKLS